MTALQKNYQTEIAPRLKESLGLKNVNEIPRIEKVVINVGAGRAVSDSKILEVATNTLRKISGQQPVITSATQSIAGFKLREGAKIGVKVTLRGRRMFEFLERLINVVLPRMRDFHGVSVKAFDPQGNYSLGLKDQTVFPELNYDDTTFQHGLQINIVTKNKNPEHSRALLKELGFPFEKKGDK